MCYDGEGAATMPSMTRRAVLLGGPPALLWPAVGRARRTASRIACLDHGLAQTLIALDAPPVGLTQTQWWSTWTVAPPLPSGIANLGANREVNMEVLVQLRPDLIVSTPYLAGSHSRLSRIAPVDSFPIHAVGTSPYPNIVAATRRLGSLTGRDDAAEALIERTERTLADLRRAVAPLRPTPVVMLNFVDTRHVRIYGPNCLFQDTVDRLDLRNGWPGRTNAWGFSTVGIEALSTIGDAYVFVLDPVPPDVFAVLRDSPLWRNLPFVKAGRVVRFPNILMFGTLPSVLRLGRLLADFGSQHG